MVVVNEPLEKAKKGLQFEDVSQSRVDAWVEPKFDPRFGLGGQDCRLQLKHHVVESNLIEIKGNESPFDIFRVYIDVGARLVLPGDKTEERPIAQIEASYRVDYRITETSLIEDKAALDTFALENASYHLWPYWREFVMSQSLRMNLPKIALPVRMLKS
ncbi:MULTISPECIES: hypothetical protein [Marinobacter]|uniref:hypothetical protein n=1 Tax=Marinobacter TaxID=2742 RepID=UPI001903CD17|nr:MULTISPECIES: hypothetical protein [unclassified Marinobacter]MBK1887902.1 hypothetical protein [Marinobacter sp. DY40_1A1]|tara:strand:+ start:3868 stop:4344 length:477 start_codon:yes stop_codon:yes gene_type:complete